MTLVADYNFAPGLFHITFICVSCEIGKERIRRAAEKIKRENGCENRDFGFRVLRLDESNMEDVYYMPEEYTQEMLYGLETNIKPDRTDLDLLFACLTEWGLLLSKPYSSEKISGYTVHYYDGKELAACFNENISETVIRKIAGQHPRRAVFCDASFSDSAAKINMSELFRTISQIVLYPALYASLFLSHSCGI